MNVPTRRERRKQPIRRSVTSAIELYLDDMNGHEVNDLYHVVLSEVEPAILDVVMQHVDGTRPRRPRCSVSVAGPCGRS